MLKRLTCRLSAHIRVTTQTFHPVGRDIIAEQVDCSRCGKVLRSWPPPLGAPTRAAVFYVEPEVVPVVDLDPQAWSIMCWRQEHLPLGRVRNRADRDSLRIVEDRAAIKVAKRFRLGDPDSFSLATHHRDEVERRVTKALPMHSRDRDSTASLRGSGVAAYQRFVRRPRAPSFPVGWGTWFKNRKVGFRWRLFRVRTFNVSRWMDLQQRVRERSGARP